MLIEIRFIGDDSKVDLLYLDQDNQHYLLDDLLDGLSENRASNQDVIVRGIRIVVCSCGEPTSAANCSL